MRTARHIAAGVRIDIETIADRLGTKTKAFQEVSRHSGLSLSLVSKFYYGARSNVTANTLDALHDAASNLARGEWE